MPCPPPCFLPDPRGAGLHMGFQFSYVHLLVHSFVCLCQTSSIIEKVGKVGKVGKEGKVRQVGKVGKVGKVEKEEKSLHMEDKASLDRC